jgi:solute carrier family 25 aspartate/glutamate transporter 12/13
MHAQNILRLLVIVNVSLVYLECSSIQSRVIDFSAISNRARDASAQCTWLTKSVSTVRQGFKATQDFWIGAAAGGFASFVVFPIDLAKTRIQDQVIVPGTKAKYRNTIQTITKVARKEGFQSVYHGVVPVIIGSAPSSALQLSGYACARSFLSRLLGVVPDALPLHYQMLAGGFGGLCEVIANSPMESIKIIKQVQGRAAGSTATIVRSIRLGGLFHGWSACMLRDVGFGVIYFPVYSHTKQWLADRRRAAAAAASPAAAAADARAPAPAAGPMSPEELVDSFLAGLAAAGPAGALTTPADAIKTRMQAGLALRAAAAAAGRAAPAAPPPTLLAAARGLWAEGGAAALFRGVGARSGRLAPQLAITLVLYDGITRLLAG